MAHVWSFVLFLGVVILVFVTIKIDRYLVYTRDLIWPTIFNNVDPPCSGAVENVKDSKSLFMGGWSLFKNGTNHPSIAHRGVSCSKVGVGEPAPSHVVNYIFVFWKHKKSLAHSFFLFLTGGGLWFNFLK